MEETPQKPSSAPLANLTDPRAMATGASAPSSSNPSQPVLASGDWTKNLVHLAKTAELKYVPLSPIPPPLFVLPAR